MTDQEDKNEAQFWNNILQAVRTSPQKKTTLRGGSGLEHEFIAVGVDETGKRLVVVSTEHEGRTAALVQTDVQAALTGYRVLTIRPAAFSIPKIAQALQAAFGTPVLNKETFEVIQKDKEFFQKTLEPTLAYGKAIGKNIPLRMLPQLLEVIQQLARLKITPGEIREGGVQGTFSVDLTNLLNHDPIAADRTAGVCGFPFYDFDAETLDAIASTSSPEVVVQALNQRDILQFFFPGPDQLALGLVEGGIRRAGDVLAEIRQAPILGHPLGQMEIVDPRLSALNDVIDALGERKLLVEGEYGLELSDEGKKTRFTVKFKPKEGLISKLISQFSLKIDLKDIFGPGKNS